MTENFTGLDVCIKFLRYNSKDSIDSKETPIDKVNKIMSILNENKIETEYYLPPAQDIGGSCGQILTKVYLEYNRK